jgi:protein quaking
MFEAGPFTPLQRAGTFVYKGALFAIVGFSAGLLGTCISNGLLAARRKLDPAFQPQNRAAPPLLNASTWALHMGLSSNLRYQTLNGLEFAIAPFLPSSAFKASVLFLRAANNLLGGMSFVLLAKLTGSQKLSDSPTIAAAAAATAIVTSTSSKHHEAESQTR